LTDVWKEKRRPKDEDGVFFCLKTGIVCEQKTKTGSTNLRRESALPSTAPYN
jgi:hypothetical protein